ncbi:hypothetical protein CIHG_03812 [Coccidioides immitis H538.4]|uniref:Uncharacterized protein n=1 Tax=Coccidioides immitis H538.4 TaxID=396776 RepID=A0A0J8RLS2_COCIT|nr:hypothetical protein CIHG_03812 [Coccidioides immitis H538.4]
MILADSAINFLGWFCFWQQEKAAGWPVWRHARRTLSEIMVQVLGDCQMCTGLFDPINPWRIGPTPNFEARSPVMGKRTKNTKSVSQKLPSLEPAQPSRDRNDQAQRAARAPWHF